VPIENDAKIKELLTAAKTVAVIGASSKPWRDSHRIARYLKKQGYAVIPVNPTYAAIDGAKCYPDLKSVGVQIDIVDVFRNPDAMDKIVDDAVAAKAKVLWMQLGVINEEAARKAERAGLQVVMDHCIAIDHSRLVRPR
jgi:predicted CoA-binding protein